MCYIFAQVGFLCMYLIACMCVDFVSAWCLWRPKEGIGYPGSGVIDSCELLATETESSGGAEDCSF